MRRIGDSYHYDHPEQPQPYHWLTWFTVILMAGMFALFLSDTLPWNPWITFWAVIALGAGERLLLKPRKPKRRH